MGFLGMDLVAVRSLGRRLERQSEEVRAISNGIDALLHDVAWSGADRERFAAAWAGETMPAVRRAADLLSDASRTAFDEATRQEETSRDYS